MQNWDTMQTTANYEQHNTWYNSMFATHIKSEPGTEEPPQPQPQPHQMPTTSQLEHYLKQHHQQQQQQHQSPLVAMDTMSAMTPSPSNADSMQHFFDSNMQQQLLQQQQYQQQFQHAQQAAAQTQLASAHLPLGFNPLTPPGLPSAVLPTMPHFYNPTQAANMRAVPQTPSPTPQTLLATTPMDASEKLQSALTPRNTPPMDVTPPKSPKAPCSTTAVVVATNSGPSPAPSAATEKDHELLSNASEDMKHQRAESDDDESIRMPIYNSHGKMKNYKCKSCGMVAITKIAFWAHARTHMKPEKILQCPKCPFVTELKHHLEYHIRKHKNLKPFQCDKCSYTCVNKSMLNSHRKSHSSVYQYRCSDCDYATKYCHSFKLHLRKYEHQPGLVLDEEGLPNPSVVIDVYGTRRGPKTKSTSNPSKRNHSANGLSMERRSASNHNKPKSRERKMSSSQLSAALQSFAQHQLPSSPAKSTSSTASEFASNMTMQHQQQFKQEQQQQQQQKPKQQQQHQQNHPTNAHPGSGAVANASAMSNLLPPLASILQQNRNMAFFPYWNLNLQMLAAQQQAVLAQLSPRMRETAMQQLQLQQQPAERDSADSLHEDDDEEDDDDDDCERRSIDSAMDLSQGTPSKEEQPPQHHHNAHHHNTPPAVAMNLKLTDESNETPLNGKNGASRRKGRVLKLDALLQVKSASQSPEQIEELSALIAAANKSEAQRLNAPSPATGAATVTASANMALVKMEKHSAATEADGDESMEANATNAIAPISNGHITASADTSASSAASSSGNSSNSSTNTNGFRPVRALYECKYCDIFFKDTVLYTIHMGYHSCDDVFKCNMCGEKCDGPVGLFVHMARNAHS